MLPHGVAALHHLLQVVNDGIGRHALKGKLLTFMRAENNIQTPGGVGVARDFHFMAQAAQGIIKRQNDVVKAAMPGARLNNIDMHGQCVSRFLVSGVFAAKVNYKICSNLSYHAAQ